VSLGGSLRVLFIGLVLMQSGPARKKVTLNFPASRIIAGSYRITWCHGFVASFTLFSYFPPLAVPQRSTRFVTTSIISISRPSNLTECHVESHYLDTTLGNSCCHLLVLMLGLRAMFKQRSTSRTSMELR
jgi:hypothetical protein